MPKLFKKSKKSKQLPQAETALEDVKQLQDFSASFPEQLKLFEFIQPTERRYSNTIELYDFMPKYHWGKTERINDKFLESLERNFECRGMRYKIEVSPARLKGKDGKLREHYPSKREELVEDALRRFATAQQGVFLDERASVTFSLEKED